MIVYRCCKHYHEGELEEEHAIEDEGLCVAPCLEPLSDDIGAAVDNERRPAGDEHGVEPRHRGRLIVGEGAVVARKAAAGGREARDWWQGRLFDKTHTTAAKSGRISHRATGQYHNVSVEPHGDCAALMNGSPCSTIV